MKGNALLDRVSLVSRTFTAALNSSLVHSATKSVSQVSDSLFTPPLTVYFVAIGTTPRD